MVHSVPQSPQGIEPGEPFAAKGPASRSQNALDGPGCTRYHERAVHASARNGYGDL